MVKGVPFFWMDKIEESDKGHCHHHIDRNWGRRKGKVGRVDRYRIGRTRSLRQRLHIENVISWTNVLKFLLFGKVK